MVSLLISYLTGSRLRFNQKLVNTEPEVIWISALSSRLIQRSHYSLQIHCNKPASKFKIRGISLRNCFNFNNIHPLDGAKFKVIDVKIAVVFKPANATVDIWNLLILAKIFYWILAVSIRNENFARIRLGFPAPSILNKCARTIK